MRVKYNRFQIEVANIQLLATVTTLQRNCSIPSDELLNLKQRVREKYKRKDAPLKKVFICSEACKIMQNL